MKAAGNLVTGVAAGTAAGLVASFVMNGCQQIWTTVAEAARPKPAGGDDAEPATVKAADKLSQACTGEAVPKRFRRLAGAGMHYGLGAALGGAYGALSALILTITAGRGSVFGAAAWLALDEGVLPAAGLAKPWNETPDDMHFYPFVSHLVFGLTLDGATRRFKRLFS